MQEFILGSDAMRSIMKEIDQVAKYDVNVLIMGESGTGKELLAKIIHLQSPRAENPFEDKLFGHEKGSFTGAIRREKGCLELADKGTLFLDEVAEIPPENQVDFLRVLEDFQFIRIGGSELIKVDIRLISATNKDLRNEVRQGSFRDDLFYRLHLIPVYIPPLRERISVIPKMLDRFLDQLATSHKKPKPTVKSEVIDIFSRYYWPGNVRELKNLVERVFILNNQAVINIEHLPSDFLWHFRDPPRRMNLEEVKRSAETKAILNVLHRVGGDKKRAAEILDISPRTLRHKLNKYNLKVDRKGEPVRQDKT
ncbi:MAG: sigma-54-dependent Fis family transcriptional regulator [Deltaproteobacteria bacterium]|nr:sigma-54-dependent Fis family transcriptional regulator [Deltaproteobacteria bacterium]